MIFALCTHLTATTPVCDPGLPAGTACVRICKSADGTQARLQIRNVHSAARGELFDAGTPPSGFDAVFDFEHDTSATQSPGTTVDGDWIPYSGGAVKIRIRYQGPSGPAAIDLETNDPDVC